MSETKRVYINSKFYARVNLFILLVSQVFFVIEIVRMVDLEEVNKWYIFRACIPILIAVTLAKSKAFYEVIELKGGLWIQYNQFLKLKLNKKTLGEDKFEIVVKQDEKRYFIIYFQLGTHLYLIDRVPASNKANKLKENISSYLSSKE